MVLLDMDMLVKVVLDHQLTMLVVEEEQERHLQKKEGEETDNNSLIFLRLYFLHLCLLLG